MSSAIERLQRDEALRREGVLAVLDVMLRRRVSDYVELGGLADLIVELLGAQNVSRLVEVHLLPTWERHRARVAETSERVGDTLPPDVRDELEGLVVEMVLPKLDWAASSIDPALLRDLFAPALTEWLLDFVRRLPIVGGGVSGGLAGAFKAVGGKGARRVLGGMDERIQSVAERFSQGALAELRRAIGARIESDEGQRIVVELRKQILAAVLAAEVGRVMDDVDRLPRTELLRLLPRIAEHNAARAFGERVLREETAAVIRAEGERTVSEVLEAAGVLPEVRAYLRLSGEEIFADLVRDDAFAAWLAALES